MLECFLVSVAIAGIIMLAIINKGDGNGKTGL